MLSLCKMFVIKQNRQEQQILMMLKGEKLTQNSLKETSAVLCSLRTEIHGLPKNTSPTENPLQTLSPC